MKCQDLMTLDLRWIRDNATLWEAATTMRDCSIGFLPVLDERGALVGVVTDRDLAVRACAENRAPDETVVGEVMSAPAVVCREEQPLRRAEELMAAHRISRLPVLGPADNVVGVISLADVVARRGRFEALRTARGVLARDSGGPHAPLESLRLTPSEPRPPGGDDERLYDDVSRSSDEARSVAIGRLPGMR